MFCDWSSVAVAVAVGAGRHSTAKSGSSTRRTVLILPFTPTTYPREI